MRIVSAREFATKLANKMPPTYDPSEKSLWGGGWSNWMFRHLHALAKEGLDLGCCCKTGGHPRSWEAATKERGFHREYLFDMTWYDAWGKWAQPTIIIEHENLWKHDEFVFDHWKLVLGFAPLRVSFGYAASQDAVASLAAALRDAAEQGAWNHPAIAEDLVLLGYAGMGPRDFAVLHRARGQTTYADAGTLARPDIPT